MIVGVVGLGLIGGSFAKAYFGEGHTVLAADTDENILGFAKLSGVVSADLTKDNVSKCDLVLLCVYPRAAMDFLEDFGPHIGSRPVVIDCCGTKRMIFRAGTEAAEKYGFTYVGGHPMAGTQFSGYKHSKKDLFRGAPMVIVPPVYDDIVFLDRVKELLRPVGFSGIAVTTAEKHDEVIAFTSQLAHVVSNAYIKSPTARLHNGFSAGSYKDMTRVAWLNPDMWTELFLENRENLSKEITLLINNLEEYKEAISSGDAATLRRLLDEGRKIKEEVDG